ncbi:MAG: tol-pal system protein YbgF [Hyphomicrobiales bacterium]|nr:tol-pal system protein YbgF [Hyphomicrobiales bacterium]
MALLRRRKKMNQTESKLMAMTGLTALLLLAAPLNASAFQGDRVAQAQLLPPRNVPSGQPYANQPYNGQPYGYQQNSSASPNGEDASSLFLEVQRLEGEVRRLTGEVQELQFHQRQLEKKLSQAPGGVATAATSGATASDNGQGDAFNPAAHPGAAGAPEPLGTTEPSRPLRSGTPMQLGGTTNAKPQFGRPLGLDTSKAPTNPAANAPPNAPKASYASGLSLYHQGRYRDAIIALKGFVEKNPKTAQTPDALYVLGLSYTHRNLNRQAAEQYLRLSTDFPASARAPSGLVHLGIALNALGAKEDACAALNQVAQKYPKSTSAIKQANVEARRDGC